jgi:hypothetical protein
MIIKIKNTSPPVFFVGRREEREFIAEKFSDAVVYELATLADTFMFFGLVSQYGAEEFENLFAEAPTYSVFNG